MGTRINLCEDPACVAGSPPWFGPSGWTEITGADPSLPRSTAFAGTTAGGVITPRNSVTAGAQYVASIEIYAVEDQPDADWNINWYASGSFDSASPNIHFSMLAGETLRIETGPHTAPNGVTECLIAVGVDAAAQMTAAMVEQTTETGLPYFDGDTPGATWAGTPHDSVSYLITGADTFTLSESATVDSFSPGPVGGDTFHLSESATVHGETTAADTFTLSDSGLIVALSYDDRYGRVRIAAFPFVDEVIRVEVYRRAANSTAWQLVRGGRVAVTNGRMSRTVDDYEFPAGVPVVYRIDGLSSSENQPDVVVQTATVTRSPQLTHAWVKFIAAPYLNTQVTLVGWGEISRASRNATYQVVGTKVPSVVTEVHGPRRVAVQLHTGDLLATAELDEALSFGAPIFLHVPAEIALPSLYAAIGNYSWARPSARSTHAIFSVDLTEVAAPPPSVVGATATWETLLALHLTWAEVLDVYATWQEVAAL